MPIGASNGKVYKDAFEAELDSSSYPLINVMDSTGFRQSPNVEDRRNRHPLQNAMDALKGQSNLGAHMPVEDTTSLGDDLGNFDLDMMDNPDSTNKNEVSPIQTFMGQSNPNFDDRRSEPNPTPIVDNLLGYRRMVQGGLINAANMLVPPASTPLGEDLGISDVRGAAKEISKDVNLRESTKRGTFTSTRSPSEEAKLFERAVAGKLTEEDRQELKQRSEYLQNGTGMFPESNYNVDRQRSALEKITGSDGKERYKTWPEKLFDTVVDAFKLPGDVYQGKEDPGSERAIGRATELAGALIFGPAPIARKVADGTLGSFAGVKSAAIPKEKIQLANKLLGEGADAEEVFKQTGLFTGLDQKLRYEIPDTGARLRYEIPKTGETVPLKDVLVHPELFKAYPELEKVGFRYDSSKRSGTAHYNDSQNSGKGLITMGPDTLKDPSIMLHEIQHWIQHKEGFANGGAAIEQKNMKLRFEDELNALRKEYWGDLNNPNAVYTPAQKERMQFIESVFKKDAERWTAAKAEAFANYQRLAGEVEARNVQYRFENLRTYPATKEQWEIGDALYDKGYDYNIKPGISWVKQFPEGVDDLVFKTRDGKSLTFDQLPDDVKKIAERLNGRPTSEIHPNRTMDTPADQQFISIEPEWAGPYGYGWEVNTKTPPPY